MKIIICQDRHKFKQTFNDLLSDLTEETGITVMSLGEMQRKYTFQPSTLKPPPLFLCRVTLHVPSPSFTFLFPPITGDTPVTLITVTLFCSGVPICFKQSFATLKVKSPAPPPERAIGPIRPAHCPSCVCCIKLCDYIPASGNMRCIRLNTELAMKQIYAS